MTGGGLMEEVITQQKIVEYENEVNMYVESLSTTNKKKSLPKLSIEMENAINYIETRAIFYSNVITGKLLSLQEPGISFFVELEHKLKQRERIIEKIMQKMTVDKLTLQEATDSISDVLRYTIIINDDVYTKKMDEYLSQIEEMGYRVDRFKNVWGDEFCQGIRVFFVDDAGFKFEIQFHTPFGYSIKEGKTRNVYNIIRDPKSPKDIVEKSNAIRKYYQAQVKPPIGALEYQYVSKKEKSK